MAQPSPILDYHPAEKRRTLLGLYRAVPLYLRILVGLSLGVVIGLLLTKSIFPWTGILAVGSVLQNTSLGYLIGATVSALLYLLLRALFPATRASAVKDIPTG